MYGVRGNILFRPNFDPLNNICDPPRSGPVVRITYPTLFFLVCRVVSYPMSDALTTTKVGPFA